MATSGAGARLCEQRPARARREGCAYHETSGVGRVLIERALCPVLVGRDAELSILEETLQAARRGDGGMVLLSGDAGVGKTRLATEAQRRALAVGMAAPWGGCSEAELSLPYLPFVEAIGNCLRGIDLDQLRHRLGPLSRDLARLFPQLDPNGPPFGGGGEPDDSSKLRLYEAVVVVLTAFAAEAGLLLVIEDLHWADASTWELSDYLARRLRGSRIMVLATYRAEEIQPGQALAQAIQGWHRSGRAILIQLGSLSPEGVREMICAIFALETVKDDARDRLHARCEGNPFVLEELLKAAIDGGAVSVARARWDNQALMNLKLPKTVRENIRLRVERLGKEQSELLQCAAVLGTAFDYPTLVAFTGSDGTSVLSALETSVRHQLLEEDPRGAGCYRFRHALTQQAVYEETLAPRRQHLHARAAQVLAQRPGTPPIELCGHLLAAGRWEQAIPLCLDEAQAAEKAHAYRDAAALYERTLPHLVEPVQRGNVLCRLGHALLIAGETAGAERYLAEGVSRLDEAKEARLAGAHRRWLVWAYYQRSQPELAAAEADRALAILEPLGPSEELADAYNMRALNFAVQGETDRALPLAQRAIATAEQVGAEAARLHALYVLGRTLADLGRVDEGIELLDRSYAEALEQGLTWIAGQALFHCTVALVSRFRPREALERVHRLRRLQGGEFARLRAAFLEGQIYVRALGEPLRALPALEEAIALARGGDSSMMATNAEQDRAIAHWQLDRLEEARRLLPQPPAASRPGHRLQYAYGVMRIAVDSDQARTVREQARIIFQCTDVNAHRLREYADLPVEVLLAAGDPAEAQRIVAMVSARDPDPANPFQLRMEGRLALAQGDLVRARACLQAAADFFMESAMGSHECRTRWALADALARLGDTAGAEAELRRALKSAWQRGALFEERRAREQLIRLGIRIGATAGMVRQALEQLEDDHGLSASPLMGLRGLAGGGPAGLRDLLARTIREISSSSVPRETQAGSLLRDYYLKRVGSQEVVGERLHLSRPTFYRRLHRGWELVAERLGPLDDVRDGRGTGGGGARLIPGGSNFETEERHGETDFDTGLVSTFDHPPLGEINPGGGV